MQKKAIVLLSGGLDSTTCLALATHQGYACYALSFDYGQKNKAELNAAKKIATLIQVEKHHIMPLKIGELGGSALTDSKISIQDYQNNSDIPATYVPARNIIFLSVAVGFAEIIGAKDIFIGVSAIDYSGYPDCRPVFIEAFQNAINLGTKAGIENKGFTIHTPLIHLNKAQTIQLGQAHGVDYQFTVSCYRADAAGKACGACDACALRKKGFQEANVLDVTAYQMDNCSDAFL